MLLSNPPVLRVLLAALALFSAACSSPEAQKQRHFERGNEYAAEKRDDFAVIEYANAVRIDPKFGEARLKLAETYERMNNFQAAFPEYIRAADALPDNRDLQIKVTELLIIGQRFDDAKDRADKLLAKNPKDVDALLLRANATAALKQPDEAIEDIEEALKIQPAESRAFLSLGEVQMRKGARDEAEAAFKQAISLEPSSTAAHLAYANFLWSAGRQTEAEQSIKQGIAAEPRHLMANRMLAAFYAATNRMAEAEQPLKVVAEVSQAPQAKFELAQYYVTAGRTDEAVKLLTTLSSDQTAFTRAEAMLAAIDYAKGQTKEAHARLDRLLQRAPNDAPALVQKAQWLTNEGKLDEALDRARAAVKAEPQYASAHYALGAVHNQRRETADAIKAYNEALRLNPRFAAAQIQLSRLTRSTGDSESALRYAEDAARTAPASSAARIELARTLMSRGQADRAGTEISNLLKAFPNSPVVHALNGTFQLLRQNDAAARASYTRALELSPDNTEAIGGLVALDIKNKQIPAAINRIDAALAKQPNRIELLAMAGRVYEQAGQNDRAEQVLRRAIAADPRSMIGYAMLAQLYLKQRRLDEARVEFETIVKRDPRAVGPRTLVGIILEAQGKREEARKWYEATVAQIQVAPVAANNLAFMYAEQGVNLDMALQLANAAKKEMPDSPEVNDTLGWVYYKKNLPALAVARLEESAKQRPTNADIIYHLGMAYAAAGDKVKARDALERALKMNPKMSGAATARQTLESVSR